jgi:hypothetical protein
MTFETEDRHGQSPLRFDSRSQPDARPGMGGDCQPLEDASRDWAQQRAPSPRIMSSSMDDAGNPRREDIDKPAAPLKTDRPLSPRDCHLRSRTPSTASCREVPEPEPHGLW